MSDTSDVTGAASGPPLSLGETPAPAPTDAAQDNAPPVEQTDEQTEQAERKAKGDRRFAELSAKWSAAEREREALRAENEYLRRQAAGQQQHEDTPEQRYQRMLAEVTAEVEQKIRSDTFHEQGASQFSDWRARCDDLIKMGADAGFAALLVEMPDGVKVTAALAADPEAVERIAGLRSERARAVALGKYAATLEDGGHAPARAAARPVTQAPAPVRPVTGRAAPQFNEYSASPQQLVDLYSKQALENRRR